MAGSENFHGKITGRISETGHMSGRITTPDIREYMGPYEVAPSESEQTLLTDGKRMTDNVTVDAVPSDYVGSGIARDPSLIVNGDTVTAPVGYYSAEQSETIPAPVEVRRTIDVTPSVVRVNTNGLVTADVASGNGYINPFTSAGYVGANYWVPYFIWGHSKTLQLDTQAEATITPTESEQTAVQAQKYTTGAVKVAAIPSDYVGSGVTRRDETDLTASGDTVSVPAGYYEEAESKAVPAGSAATPATTIQAQPTITLDPSTGEITASVSGSEEITPAIVPGYVAEGTPGAVGASGSNTYSLPTKAGETITPTTQEQTAVPGGKFTLNDVKVGPIPSQYHDMSGPLAWLGPDATLIKEFSLPDVKLADTNFASWTPSTTAADMLASRTAGTFVATDVEDYDYIMVFHTAIPFVYKEGATDKARPLFLAAVHIQECIRRPSSYTNIQAESDNNTVHAIAFTAGNFLRYYGSTQGTITYTWNTSYGFYGTYTAATLSSATAASPTVTVKAPKVTARCSTTYMSTANAALIDQDKTVIKQSCKVYRVKKSGLIQGAYDEIIRLVNEVDPE